ncbi:MAG: ATP synthase F1 subunit delta [Oligoflexus sp.]
MNGEKIAKRYASALFDLCDGDMNKAQEYLVKLEAISAVFDYQDIRKVLNSPVVNPSIKAEVLKKLIEHAVVDQTLNHFLVEVAKAQRVPMIPTMAHMFRKIINEKMGVVEAEAVTVVELSEDDRQAIRQRLETMTSKKVRLSSKIDPSILGGFVIRIENSVLDMSLKSKLDAMTQSVVS